MRDFKAFHIEQALAFKWHLSEQVSYGQSVPDLDSPARFLPQLQIKDIHRMVFANTHGAGNRYCKTCPLRGPPIASGVSLPDYRKRFAAISETSIANSSLASLCALLDSHLNDYWRSRNA